MKANTVYCDNCGTPTFQTTDRMNIYPCAQCGWEFDMGITAKPLTSKQWWSIERRLLGDLQRKFDNHKNINHLIRIHEEMKKTL